MRILVLGGTAWLGREIAAEAVRRGHEVTCVARGTSGAAPEGARLVRADRDRPDAYDGLAGRWDAAIDVARHPGHVRRASAALEPVVARYLLVSTGNVYADHRIAGADEDAPLREPLDADELPSMALYGEAKVACEQAVRAAFGPDRTLVARSGLIGGPGDGSGRTGYWPWRFAHPGPDGRVLVPEAAGLGTEVVDVRDLAAWLVGCAAVDRSGAYNAGGPVMPLAEHLAAARAVAGHRGAVVAAPDEWLRERGVEEWAGPRSLPLWLADPAWRGFNARDSGRARAAGLVNRPLADTLRDALAWEEAQPVDPHGAGLTDEEDRALLAALPA